jgi:hypothetical protein
VINTYLQWKINLRLEGSMAAQNFFVDLVEAYKTELDPARRELTDYLTTHPVPLRGERTAEESAEIARLQAIVDQALGRVRDAESKEENARLAMVQTESEVRQTYFTVDEPIMPIAPQRSRKETLFVMAACIAAGFVLTIVAIVGGALLDRTQRFPVDVRHGFGLPVLAVIPESRVDARLAAQNALSATGAPSDVRRTSGNEGLAPVKPRRPQRLLGYK